MRPGIENLSGIDVETGSWQQIEDGLKVAEGTLADIATVTEREVVAIVRFLREVNEHYEHETDLFGEAAEVLTSSHADSRHAPGLCAKGRSMSLCAARDCIKRGLQHMSDEEVNHRRRGSDSPPDTHRDAFYRRRTAFEQLRWDRQRAMSSTLGGAYVPSNAQVRPTDIEAFVNGSTGRAAQFSVLQAEHAVAEALDNLNDESLRLVNDPDLRERLSTLLFRLNQAAWAVEKVVDARAAERMATMPASWEGLLDQVERGGEA